LLKLSSKAEKTVVAADADLYKFQREADAIIIRTR
jgi:hypothetical protein